MVARFPNMIAIMHLTIKSGISFCEVPVNKLCIQCLRLLREHNLIFGFSYVSPSKKSRRLYPRVRIYLKYSDINTPCIRFLRPVKNTFSNHKIKKLNLKYQATNNKKLILTTPKGLTLVSYNEMISSIQGKVLVELSF